MQQPAEARLERLEALMVKGVANDASARAALLGTEKRPALKLSKVFVEYEAITRQRHRSRTSSPGPRSRA